MRENGGHGVSENGVQVIDRFSNDFELNALRSFRRQSEWKISPIVDDSINMQRENSLSHF